MNKSNLTPGLNHCCSFPGCLNKTRNEKNGICSEHQKIISHCSICGKEIVCRGSQYLKQINLRGYILCGNCNSKENAKKMGLSENAAKARLKNWKNPELRKKMSKNLIDWNNSEEGKKASRERIIAFNNSEKGKEHHKKFVEINKHRKRSEKEIQDFINRTQKVLREKYYGTDRHKQQYMSALEIAHKNWCHSKENLEILDKVRWKGLKYLQENWNKSAENLEHLKKIAKKGNYKLWNDPDLEEARKKVLKNLKHEFIYDKDENGRIIYINNIPIKEWYKNILYNSIIFNEDNFYLIPTGRMQNSTKTNSLLDDYLVKENIKWFVYIKFDELGNPLVVGESASKLVNISGCDVTFDKNPNGGPARQYLIDNNLDWDKTQIAICKCASREQALQKERDIQKKYGIFYS